MIVGEIGFEPNIPGRDRIPRADLTPSGDPGNFSFKIIGEQAVFPVCVRRLTVVAFGRVARSFFERDPEGFDFRDFLLPSDDTRDRDYETERHWVVGEGVYLRYDRDDLVGTTYMPVESLRDGRSFDEY